MSSEQQTTPADEEWSPNWEALARGQLGTGVVDFHEEVVLDDLYNLQDTIRTGDREEIVAAASMLKLRLEELADHVDHTLSKIDIDPAEAEAPSCTLDEGQEAVFNE